MPSRGSDNWTVKDVAESIAPANWTFPNDWIFWPPDVFALTSTIFQRTGCYSLVLSNKWESDPQWQADVEKAAKMWLERVSSIVSGETTDSPPADSSNLMKDAKLLKAAETIESLAPKVTIEQLQILPGWEDEDIGEEDGDLRAAQNLCEALILMHAVADEACSGLGLPASPRAKFALAHCLGNLLLTARGSLSAIPKHHGVVLPKLRTPQSGQTLRSFSHHVTWHSSEVEVMWRATPWANVEENTINILCLPWPSEISERDFSSEPETFEAVRYFRYAPPEGDNSLYLDKVVELV